MNFNGIEYDDLTIEDIDYIVEKDPCTAAEHLNGHPLFNQQHIDTIVARKPLAAIGNLNRHPFFNQQHIDYIVEKVPWKAIKHLKHRLSDENLEWLAVHYPKDYEGLFK